MAELILHQEDDQLELSGFLLKVGDQLEVLHLGSWLTGTVARDQQGWYFQPLGEASSSRTKMRLRTGLVARLTELA